jgi:HK97 family phage prohead protease/HK97 family phage major capsid protein
MQHKTVSIVGIKTAGLAEGQFEGWASTFGNTDSQNDRVMPGAFAKGLTSDRVVPLNWEHRGSVDPRALVGQLVKAEEVPEGLHVTGQFDLETEFGAAAYRAVKARRVGALSIGYGVNRATKAADGVNELHDLDLIEVSIVARPANDRAVITAAKSVSTTTAIRERLVRARIKHKGTTTMTVKTDAENRYTKGIDEQLAAVKLIVDTANQLGRDLTDEETAEAAKHLDAAEELQKAIEGAAKSADLMARLDAMAASASDDGFKRGDDPDSGVGSGETLHLALTGRGLKSLAQNVVKASRIEGTKALASGVQTTSTVLLPDVVPTGRPLVSLLDVLPTRIVEPSYTFLRQSVRNLAAAPVPVAGVKPTSVVSVIAVQNRLRVVAHISEPMDEYMMLDNQFLSRFVQDELLYGLRRALENEVIAGDGTGEHFTGILNTSGLVVQAYTTSALASVRRGITLLEANGYEVGVIVLSASDWETIELLEITSGATDVRGVPVDPVARRLWGHPVVLNQGLGAKTGLVIGANAITLDHDNLVSVKWSDAVNADFTQNQVRCRVEGRWGLSVNQPSAVVKVGTQA